MVDFSEKLKEDRRHHLRVYRMDEFGYQYWVGRSARSCYDHMISTQGEGSGDFVEVEEIDEAGMLTQQMEMDDDRILTFREALDELINLEVEFPRFFCGSEE